MTGITKEIAAQREADQIVDDRQRLVAVRDAILAEHNAALTELGRLQGERNDAVTVNWQGGKCNGLAHALQFVEHALASRPQEQPRKATGKPDYTAMDAGPMLQALGADAAKWATAFRQMALKLGYSDMDEGWLIGWFANAIETADLTRHPRSVSPAAPEGWQTIETAPKARTPVDLWAVANEGGSTGRVVDAHWEKWPPRGRGKGRAGWWANDGGSSGGYPTGRFIEPTVRVTHWMPRPAAPPSPAAQEQK